MVTAESERCIEDVRGLGGLIVCVEIEVFEVIRPGTARMGVESGNLCVCRVRGAACFSTGRVGSEVLSIMFQVTLFWSNNFRH
ncbi:unnamed protein product [Boreogadus saida]